MSYSGQSNAPWQRNNVMQGQMSNFHQGQPQQQMFQMQQNFGGHGGIFPATGTGGAVSVQYPQARSTLNPVAFQQNSVGSGSQAQHYNSIGTVTKINSDCGLVNDEVFFYRNVCKGHTPKLGDRVLFEATYSTSGQFKWNATRIQLMPQQQQQSHQPQPLMGSHAKGSGYSAVPPPNEYQRALLMQKRHNNNSPTPRRSSPVRDRSSRNDRDRRGERDRNHRPRDDDDEQDRKRRREDTERSRDRNSTAVSSRNDRDRNRVDDDNKRGGSDRGKERTRGRTGNSRDREREKDDRVERSDRSPQRGTAKGRRQRVIRRYMVQIPKMILAYKNADIQELRQRYATLHIPSDFFHANIKWSESFTPDNAFSLCRPCQFHIMHRIVEAPEEQNVEHLEPADANYRYSAKVMLLACPPIAELYEKCFDDDDSESEQHSVHPSRLISFLVGTRGRNEPMAIGGPWSPSLDGENPDTDPSVLIRTAIRTCKALTGIDLSNCTQWYRFTEIFYHRNFKNKEKDAPARIETVVIYLPDVHSCMPSTAEWQTLTQVYNDAVENVITRRTAAVAAAALASKTAAAAIADDGGDCDEADAAEGLEVDSTVVEAEAVEITEIAADGEETIADEENAAPAAEEVAAVDGDNIENEKDLDLPQPTHFSELDLKTIKVPDIRSELIARNLPSKGVRNMILARLAKAINTEKAEEAILKKSGAASKLGKPTVKENQTKSKVATTKKIIEAVVETSDATSESKADTNDNAKADENDEDWADVMDVDMSDIVILDEYDSSKVTEEVPKEMDEKEKNQLIRRYTLPNAPHIVVHPNKLAKSGKFDCSVMSLSVLLDYRPEDTKERFFFEVSLFAELFNEMLMRDFGFNIYKELFVHTDETNTDSKEHDEANTNKDAAKAGQDDSNDDKTKETTADSKSNADENSEKSSRGERRPSKRSMDEKTNEEDSQSVKSSADRKRKSTTSVSISGKEKEKDGAIDKDKKMVVVKPHLLLSFVYFDTTHCGFIFEKDLEDLFSVLDLNLSRGQIRKILGKFPIRQAFYYRKLTDKEETSDATPTIEDIDDIPAEELRMIALGNKQYDFVFNNANGSNNTTSDDGDGDGLINYNGAVVHVGKLVEQIKRTEKNYSDLEKLYNDLRKQHTDLQKDHTKSSSKMKDLQSEVKSLNRKLSDADQDVFSLNRKYRDQQSTLTHVYNRLSVHFNREKDKEHKSESSRDKDNDKEKDKNKDVKEKEKKKEHAKDDGKNKKNGEKDTKVIAKDEKKIAMEVKDSEDADVMDEEENDENDQSCENDENNIDENAVEVNEEEEEEEED